MVNKDGVWVWIGGFGARAFFVRYNRSFEYLNLNLWLAFKHLP